MAQIQSNDRFGLKSYIMLVTAMSRKAIEKGVNVQNTHKENMLAAISIFTDESLEAMKETYDKLVFMYRFMLNIPIKEYPMEKLSEVINKNNGIVEQILQQ